MSSYLLLQSEVNSTMEYTSLHSRDSTEIEPLAKPTMGCTAVIRKSSALTAMGWIKIPCNTQHEDASYICKSNRVDMPERFSKLMPKIMRSHRECAPKHFLLGEMCMYIYTVKLQFTSYYNAEKLCDGKGIQVFHLPGHISKPVILWTSEEQFAANTLVAMNHRWPSVFDYGVLDSKFLDKLLINFTINEPRPGYMILQHSKTSFSQFEVSQLDLNTMSGSLHVACQSVENLTDQTCLSGHYSCDDGTCILSHYACDGIIDCPDSSDESSCNHVCVFTNSTDGDALDCLVECFPANCTCHDLYFHCPGGGCVPWSRVCDGTPDCPGQEDEVKCHFIVGSQETPVHVIQRAVGLEMEANETTTTYTCSDERVNISQSRVNDLIPDCPSQDDEILYAEFVRNGSSVTHFNDTLLCDDPEETTCEKNFLGVCYPRYLHCVYDTVDYSTKICRKGSHLKACKHHKCPSQFKCPNTYCVPTHVLCNGRQDCPNGEDEMNCNNISCPGYLLCRHDRLCVHPYDVWNRHVKCPQSQNDKALAGYIPCPLECYCLGNAILCNGKSMQSTDKIRLLLKKKLRVDVRILVIRNINVTLGDSIWKEAESVFLIHLEISNANLSFIQKEHFIKLAFVRTLNLSHNSIIALSRGAFNKLQNLEVIDLSYNLISMLNASTFFGLNFLQFIAIGNNNLRFIEACTFAGLSNIETIYQQTKYLLFKIFCFVRLQNRA